VGRGGAVRHRLLPNDQKIRLPSNGGSRRTHSSKMATKNSPYASGETDRLLTAVPTCLSTAARTT
jgi:hypothetical protein